jgi:3D (Asp-Asp-Asp) domain-containing protein
MPQRIPHNPLSGRSEDTLPIVSPWQPFIATWYSGSGGSDGGHVTRTGTTPRNDWTIAVDPNVIPLHAVVQVRFPDGTIQTYQALDTGGAIIGDRIDIFDSNTSQCFRNGRQHVMLRILAVR